MLRSLRRLLSIGVVSGIFLFPQIVAAASAGASLQVSATVLPWVHISAEQRIDHYHIDDHDTRRGYLDLPGALEVAWQTNSRRCIVLEVSSARSEATGTENNRLTALQLCLPPPLTPKDIGRMVVDLRLPITPQTAPGAHPLALRIIPTLFND